MPGLGSLAAVAVGNFKGGPADASEQISKELLASFEVVSPQPKVSKLSRITGRASRKKKREARRLLAAGADLSSLMEVAGQRLDGSGGTDRAALSPADQQSLAALGEAQLAMANSAGFVPGLWQDEFAALLQTVCEEELRKGGLNRDRWRRLIGLGEVVDDPGGMQLTALMRSVARVFAARIAANPALEGLTKELRQSDSAAAHYALLWRLDQQRRSLALIAAVLAMFAASLGIGIDVIE